MGQTSSSSNWDGSKMPSQAGKIAIVTGANSGTGYLVARALAGRGAYVVLACRSESRGRTAEQEMTAYLTALKKKQNRGIAFTHVDLLINNAGVTFSAQLLTADGIESHFGVNHVSHFLFTALLFNLLKAAPAARVVSVSSMVHREAASLEFNSLVKGTDHPWRRYCKSKLANLLFTYELGHRLEAAKVSNVIAVAAHRFLWPLAKWFLETFVLQPAEMGALPALYAATAEGVANGDFYGPNGPGGRRGYPAKEVSSPPSHNRNEATRLWTLSEELTGETFAV